MYISKILRSVFGIFSFSVGDILYAVLIVYCLYWLYKKRKSHWKEKGVTILSFLSVAYFLFHFLWAMNYYRLSLFEKMNIRREYSTNDLILFTEKLIAKTNDVQFEITKNKNKKVVNPYSQEVIFKNTQNGYNNLAKQYSYFTYTAPSKKKSLLSLPLTYMGFGGYLNPFTNEAQVNNKLPMYGFPAVVTHEMAHQMGFGSESECNFIGFLACIKNDDAYYQYAAYSNALRYCLANIAFKNESQFKRLKKKINLGIIKNYQESELFWDQYDTIIDNGFHAFYDQFLKVNQQKDGIESYNKFVDLLVNYYRNKDF